MSIKRILVTLGGTPFLESEIQTAIALARRHDASLTGMALVDPQRLASVGPVPLGAGAAAAELAAHRGEEATIRMHVAATMFERICNESNVPCATDFEEGTCTARLERQWRSHDLVVAGLRGLFEYGLVTDPEDAVLEIVHAGVRPILAVAMEPRDIRRVMIASSGTHVSSATIKSFVHLGPYPEAEIDLVRFDDSERHDAVPLEVEADYLGAHGYRVRMHQLQGVAREQIIETAQKYEADLIVLGAARRRKLARTLLGDTVAEALRASPLPLFLSR